jgi:hypothetical protein
MFVNLDFVIVSMSKRFDFVVLVYRVFLSLAYVHAYTVEHYTYAPQFVYVYYLYIFVLVCIYYVRVLYVSSRSRRFGRKLISNKWLKWKRKHIKSMYHRWTWSAKTDLFTWWRIAQMLAKIRNDNGCLSSTSRNFKRSPLALIIQCFRPLCIGSYLYE